MSRRKTTKDAQDQAVLEYSNKILSTLGEARAALETIEAGDVILGAHAALRFAISIAENEEDILEPFAQLVHSLAQLDQ